MTEAQVLLLIQSVIIANGNNEITADILRPVLEEIVKQPNVLIGDLDTLDTTNKDDLVSAINEVFNNSGSDIVIRTGTTDPNVTPPAVVNIGDFYVWDDGTLQGFYQYNGNEFVLVENLDLSDIISGDSGNAAKLGTDGKIFVDPNINDLPPVENEYATVDGVGGLLDSQGDQTEGYLQYVVDASADPSVPPADPNKKRFYLKLATSTADISDYEMLSDNQINFLIDITEKLDRGGYAGTAQDLADAIASGGGIQSIQEGANITVDNSDPLNPVVSATGGGGSSELNTKGDILTFDSAPARLGVGSNGQVLTADNSTAKGLKWSDLPPSGGSTAKLIPNTGSELDFNDSKEMLCNLGSANSTATYTIKAGAKILNSYNQVLVNRATEPTIDGGNPVHGATFIPNTDMYMVANWKGADRGVEYFFLNIGVGSVPEYRPLYDRLITASVSGTYTISVKDAETWRVTMTGNTIFSESNLPPPNFTKTYSIQMNGDFSPTWPASWSDFLTGKYEGTALLNTIVIEYVDGTLTKVQITQND